MVYERAASYPSGLPDDNVESPISPDKRGAAGDNNGRDIHIVRACSIVPSPKSRPAIKTDADACHHDQRGGILASSIPPDADASHHDQRCGIFASPSASTHCLNLPQHIAQYAVLPAWFKPANGISDLRLGRFRKSRSKAKRRSVSRSKTRQRDSRSKSKRRPSARSKTRQRESRSKQKRRSSTRSKTRQRKSRSKSKHRSTIRSRTRHQQSRSKRMQCIHALRTKR